MVNIDIKKLVHICNFREDQKKKILDNLENLTSEAQIELWDLCLENLLWKMETEISRRFHEGVFKGANDKKDSNDYTRLEADVLLEFFTRAEMEIRADEIQSLQNVLKSHKKAKESSKNSQSKIVN